MTKDAQTLITNLGTQYNLDTVTDIDELTQLTKMYTSSTSFTDANRTLLGFKIGDINKCTFNNVECALNGTKSSVTNYYTEFHWIWLYDYGNCFQFNSGSNYTNEEISLKKSKRPGPQYGLSLTLGPLINFNQYVTSDSTGIVIFIHQDKYLPQSSDALFLQPGRNGFIPVKKTVTNNYPSPFSECTDLTSYSSSLYTSTLSLYGGVYRQQDCFNLFNQQNIINKCGCYYTAYPMLTQASPCLDVASYECINEQLNDFSDEEASKQCPLECSSTTFDISISTLEYPTKQRYNILLNDYTDYMYYYAFEYEYNQPPPVTNLTLTQYQELFLQVNIYYPALKVTEITQSPKLSAIDLLSQIGGSLGMFLSFSMFTLLEVFEIFGLSIYVFFFKKKKKLTSKEKNKNFEKCNSS